MGKEDGRYVNPKTFTSDLFFLSFPLCLAAPRGFQILRAAVLFLSFPLATPKMKKEKEKQLSPEESFTTWDFPSESPVFCLRLRSSLTSGFFFGRAEKDWRQKENHVPLRPLGA